MPRMKTILLAALLLVACNEPSNTGLLGYVEADYIYAAPVSAGRIIEVVVKRGDSVAAGAKLFTLDATDETAKRDQAAAALEQAKAKLADLQTGDRPEELAVIQAQLDAAKASMTLSVPRVERRRTMVKTNIVGVEQVDEAEAALLADRGHIAEYTARLAAAKLPARADQIAAAEHAVNEAKSALAAAQWALDQRQVTAAAAGRIEDVYFRPGEEANAGAAVLQLLPPSNLKLRLYVPEPELGRYKIGQRLAIACDGCAAGQTATISFIATAAEFTPPVIYSRESRAKLVHLIEARPDDTALPWHPGQPIEANPVP
ncbi:HlyD family secretion protein [Dongia sedimenti]|uniref:HlyD family efflux transporter periplasmic adaptor subunit n=1 Tax=Dongia sedimenti TaxID=3064282 RepID=A0ABU0YNV2_9PROT|nr:HlyD family efflux transporter periplasmic adaptor subunit [Rhodospirillaceae bacterium R-7]